MAVLTATGAAAQDIKIGTIYDLTGPFAGGGSKPAFIGNKIAIDMVAIFIRPQGLFGTKS